MPEKLKWQKAKENWLNYIHSQKAEKNEVMPPSLQSAHSF